MELATYLCACAFLQLCYFCPIRITGARKYGIFFSATETVGAVIVLTLFAPISIPLQVFMELARGPEFCTKQYVMALREEQNR